METGFADAAVEYASFIFLGLSLTIGYIVWRIVGTKRGGPSGEAADDALRAELERVRKEGAGGGASGLEGPGLSPEERAALRAARKAQEPAPDYGPDDSPK
ncbi:MAG: hypothetical protein SF028_04060 [Candidatus Sumerlaeia bacterium]|nr:hypothetical protein [Candidatus Sumerlaeia bacterium]